MESKKQPNTATFSDNKGHHIFYRNWAPDGKPKGIVLIVHGLNSHRGYYLNFASKLYENGYEVYALDLPGRGRSEGERFYIPDYQDVLADIDQLLAIAKNASPTIPVFLFGHSAGGVFASVYAVNHQDKLKGLISESFAFQIPAPVSPLPPLKYWAVSYRIPGL